MSMRIMSLAAAVMVIMTSAATGTGAPARYRGTTAQKQAATFIARRGLANSECYSFESSTSAGQFLRHSRFRIRLNTDDGSALFAADATFGAVPGYTPQGLSWQSFNYPTRYLRRHNNQLWIAGNGGRPAADTPINWANDTTWFTAAPWVS
jgi:non-reducing end alpha-L-arabinofuranosidase